MILVNVWEGVDPFQEARQFCELWGVDGPVLVDVHGAFTEQLAVRGVPTNILVDEQGTVTCVGASTPQALEAAVRRLLGPDAPLEQAAGADAWSWDKEFDHISEHVGRRVVKEAGTDTAAQPDTGSTPEAGVAPAPDPAPGADSIPEMGEPTA